MNAQQDSYGNYSPIQTPQAPGNPVVGSGIVYGSGNPNGILSNASQGQLYFDYTNRIFYTAAFDGSTWNVISGSGGGGATVFTELTDVPGSYSGAANKAVTVNAGATGLVFTGVLQSQIVSYTSGTPANPPNTALIALAVDPTRQLPTLTWNPSDSTWG